jgi:DNA polymerase I
MPYILGRFEENKIPKTIGRCKQKPAIIKKFGNKTRCNITGRIVADVYLLVKESVGKGLLRLKRYGLGDVAKELINESKIDIAHSEIGKFWNGSEDQINKLIEYGRKDAELVLKILLSRDMLGKFIELSKISGVLLQDALDGGEATRVENLLLREFNKLDFVIPNKPTSKEIMRMLDERETRGLKGALVLEPEIGLHTNCVVYLDFKALYPSIFISYNICPTTLVLDKQTKLETIDTPIGVKFVSPKIKQGVFPRIIEQLIKERDKVKKEMRSASEQDKKILDAKQNALKIMANAFYGYTGYIRARFYILDIANAITSCGRNLIQETKKIVESDTRLKVIYGDTDSLMVKLQTTDLDEALKLGMEIEDNINKKLLGKVTMKIESIFKTLLVLTKKRYAGLSCEKVNGEWKEKILMKGIETIRRDWCDLTSKTLFNVLNVLLREQDVKKALSYVKDVLGKLDRNEVPVEDLIVTKSISKPLKDYKGVQPHIELVKKMRQRYPASAPGIGDRVEFVIVKGTQLMSARAEDPEYVKKHGLKIDSRYYIESQVLPPLERVFEAIGIGKQELMTVGKQLILTEAIRNGLKKPMENEPLKKIDGFICSKCDTTYRRIPLIGKCAKCDGEILFYSGEMRSRYFTM